MYLDSVLRAQSKTHKMSAYMKQIREDQAKTQEPCTEPKRTKELTAETVQNLLIDMVCSEVRPFVDHCFINLSKDYLVFIKS